MTIRLYLLCGMALGALTFPSRSLAAEWFVAPNGSDQNSGSLDAPFASVQRAQRSAQPGDIVYLRGGVYSIGEEHIARVRHRLYACVVFLDKDGERDNPIRYHAYPGERPVFDCSNCKPRGRRVVCFWVEADWIHIKGVEVTGVPVTIRSHTESYCFYTWGNHNIFENLTLRDNQGTGLRHRRGGHNLFLNCDAYRNHNNVSEDGRGGNTDGFGCHPTGPHGVGNVIRGCRAWFNSDDGFDLLGAEQPVTVENCWAFYNGLSPKFERLADGNGFKMGGGYHRSPVESRPSPAPSHTIRRCVAVGNKASGFYSNHHIAGSVWLHNTAYRNSVNYNMLNKAKDSTADVPGWGHLLRNNLGFKARRREVDKLDFRQSDAAHNSFNLPVRVEADDFQSLDEQLLTAPRQADGGLPENGFLRLKAVSDLIDRGVDLGEPHHGAAPDLGAFEFRPDGAR